MKKQLALDVQLKDFSNFDNFVTGDNQEAVEKINEIITAADPGVLFLWGATGSGKTHLLKAACHFVGDSQRQPLYIPLASTDDLSPEILAGVSESAIVCIDDVDAIAGENKWERALFTLYEELRGQTSLIVTAKVNPRSLELAMPDLVTRLGSSLVYQIHLPSDKNKIRALQLRASQCGFELADEVGKYILNRFPRDTHALFSLLAELDRASLVTQRKITIPFIQEMEAGK